MTNPELRSLIAVVIAIVLMFGTLLFGIWWLWWRLPKWQVNRLALKIRDPKARADLEDNFRKTVGQALGGAAVLIGAAFALFQFLQQQKAAQEQQQMAQNQFSQQQKAAHDLLISNQVSKGFEQLASDKMAMRLGGIYGLEGVMNTSEQYHGSVLEGLCAFVRENTTLKTASENKPAIDVQAALTVIGRRAEGIGRIDLANVSIRGANLMAANLMAANLRGAGLRGANLSGANLSGANLSDANLSGANLFGANLAGAALWDADLSGANLSRAILSDANLFDAVLTGANLSGANLFGANLSNVDLTRAYNLTQEQLEKGACGNADTKPPEGLTLKAMCKK